MNQVWVRWNWLASLFGLLTICSSWFLKRNWFPWLTTFISAQFRMGLQILSWSTTWWPRSNIHLWHGWISACFLFEQNYLFFHSPRVRGKSCQPSHRHCKSISPVSDGSQLARRLKIKRLCLSRTASTWHLRETASAMCLSQMPGRKAWGASTQFPEVVSSQANCLFLSNMSRKSLCFVLAEAQLFGSRLGGAYGQVAPWESCRRGLGSCSIKFVSHCSIRLWQHPSCDSILLVTASFCDIFQVNVQPGSPAKIGATKPKVYLTCALKLPPNTWTKMPWTHWVGSMAISSTCLFRIVKCRVFRVTMTW